MLVVCHHIGRPRHSTMIQKEAITQERRRVSDGVSGGGSFLAPLAVVGAVAGVVVLSAAAALAVAAVAAGLRRVKSGLPPWSNAVDMAWRVVVGDAR
jgi:hypothetical protein